MSLQKMCRPDRTGVLPECDEMPELSIKRFTKQSAGREFGLEMPRMPDEFEFFPGLSDCEKSAGRKRKTA